MAEAQFGFVFNEDMMENALRFNGWHESASFDKQWVHETWNAENQGISMPKAFMHLLKAKNLIG